MTVDPRAASGFASAADEYERARPSYPADAVAALARRLGVDEHSTILDLGAGTGKLTRLLVPHAGRVIAVDQSEPMLARLRRELPTVEVRAGVAEAIPLPDGSVDAVFVGQAFHWFGTEAACRDIARVLRPKGALGLVWNHGRWDEGENAPPWHEAFVAFIEPLRKAAGDFPAEDWKEAIARTGLFEDLQLDHASHDQHLDSEGFVELIASWSWIANLPDDRRAEVLADTRRLAEQTPDIALHHDTELYSTRLRA